MQQKKKKGTERNGKELYIESEHMKGCFEHTYIHSGRVRPSVRPQNFRKATVIIEKAAGIERSEGDG